MKHIRKINELRLPGILLHDSILRMARINDPFRKLLSFNRRMERRCFTKTIQKHRKSFILKIKTYLIPTLGEWNQNKELYISETSNGDYNWTGLKKEKKSLIEWLDKPNNNLNLYTNIEIIRQQWNILNTDNKNVPQIKRIK